MKKIQREVKAYEDIYVSVDGKEFKNEADCKAWENSYRGTLEASWKRIKKEEVDAGNLGLAYASCDDECYVIKPKNLDEIVLINAYTESSTYGDGANLTTEHIGKLVALNFGYDHDYCAVVILEDHLNDLKKYVCELEGKFNEEKEEN
jgi:hypothetical protein